MISALLNLPNPVFITLLNKNASNIQDNYGNILENDIIGNMRIILFEHFGT